MFTPEILGMRDYLISYPVPRGRTISDANHELCLSDGYQTCIPGGVEQLSNRSVLLTASGQLLSALGMIELDGLARRLLLCPPDVGLDVVRTLIDEAEIDVIVTDQPQRWLEAGVDLVLPLQFPEPTTVRPR